MGVASVKVHIGGLAKLFQLPDYVEVKGVSVDRDTSRLVVVVESEAIPEEVVELIPIYTEENILKINNPNVKDEDLDWENAPLCRYIKGIKFFDINGNEVD